MRAWELMSPRGHVPKADTVSALDEHQRGVLLAHEGGRYGETGRLAASVAMLALSYLLRG